MHKIITKKYFFIFITFILIVFFSFQYTTSNAQKTAAEGMMWQPDNLYRFNPQTIPQQHISTLLVQWSVVDDQALISDCGSHSLTTKAELLNQISDKTKIIVGLAGSYNEPYARKNYAKLISQSQCLSATQFPFEVSGWYFPVEVDPTWPDIKELATLLNQLPKPLWISVYDNSNIGPEALAKWVKTWLPDNVNVLFQDGVGLYMRTPEVAVQYMHALQQTLGKDRVNLIAEAFRPNTDGKLRKSTKEEFDKQLAYYTDFHVFIFESRYVPDNWKNGD